MINTTQLIEQQSSTTSSSSSSSLKKDHLYEISEDGKHVLVAATKEYLIKLAADDNSRGDNTLLQEICTAHTIFIESFDLLNIFIDRKYYSCISYWVQEHYSQFEENNTLKDYLLSVVKTWPESKEKGARAESVPINRFLRNQVKQTYSKKSICQQNSVKSTPRPHLPILPNVPSPVVVSLLAMHPEEIARQLTIVEFDLFKKITSNELIEKIRKKNPKAPNLGNMINRTNNIVYGLATEILNADLPKQRAAVISQCIEIAQHCRKFLNFNSLMEILGALNILPVSRLKRTWQTVPEHHLSQLEALEEEMKPRGGYLLYRQQLSESKDSPVIPFLGIFLRDLTLANENVDVIDDMINHRKTVLFAKLLNDICRMQNNQYDFEEVGPIQEYFENMQVLSEDDLYAKSVKAESVDSKEHKSKLSKKIWEFSFESVLKKKEEEEEIVHRMPEIILNLNKKHQAKLRLISEPPHDPQLTLTGLPSGGSSLSGPVSPTSQGSTLSILHELTRSKPKFGHHLQSHSLGDDDLMSRSPPSLMISGRNVNQRSLSPNHRRLANSPQPSSRRSKEIDVFDKSHIPNRKEKDTPKSRSPRDDEKDKETEKEPKKTHRWHDNRPPVGELPEGHSQSFPEGLVMGINRLPTRPHPVYHRSHSLSVIPIKKDLQLKELLVVPSASASPSISIQPPTNVPIITTSTIPSPKKEPVAESPPDSPISATNSNTNSSSTLSSVVSSSNIVPDPSLPGNEILNPTPPPPPPPEKVVITVEISEPQLPIRNEQNHLRIREESRSLSPQSSHQGASSTSTSTSTSTTPNSRPQSAFVKRSLEDFKSRFRSPFKWGSSSNKDHVHKTKLQTQTSFVGNFFSAMTGSERLSPTSSSSSAPTSLTSSTSSSTSTSNSSSSPSRVSPRSASAKNSGSESSPSSSSSSSCTPSSTRQTSNEKGRSSGSMIVLGSIARHGKRNRRSSISHTS